MGIPEWLLPVVEWGAWLWSKISRKKPLCKVNILFIDDEHYEFDIVRTLSNSKRYGRVESTGDLDDLDSSSLRDANIVFLDVHGVWKRMNLKNWMSLVDMILEKYPDKLITIYSSKGIPKDSNISSWIATIPKNATHEDFNSHIKARWDKK